MIVIGIGANSKATVSDVAAAIADLRALHPAAHSIATFAPSPGHAVITEAARAADIPLQIADLVDMHARSDECATQSAHGLERYGVGSVAESAALVIAGPNSQLISPRRIFNHVTAAAARSQPTPERP